MLSHNRETVVRFKRPLSFTGQFSVLSQPLGPLRREAEPRAGGSSRRICSLETGIPN